MLLVFLGCLLVLSLSGAAFWRLWLERPNHTVTTDDVKHVRRTSAQRVAARLKPPQP